MLCYIALALPGFILLAQEGSLIAPAATEGRVAGMCWKYAGHRVTRWGVPPCLVRNQRATEKVVSLRCMIRLNCDQSLNYWLAPSEHGGVALD